MTRSLVLLPLVLVALTACGDDESTTLGSGGSGGTGGGSGGTGGASGGAGGASGSGGSSGAAGAPGALTLALPQAVDGALLGNQQVYAELPLRVATTGKPDSVEVDHRSYSVSLATGHIELYTAPVSADLSEGTETVFGHARFIAGTSELNLV